MARHINSSTNLKNKEINIKIENNSLENTTDSNKLGNAHDISDLPSLVEESLDAKLHESEAKISKLISEIEFLKKKVSYIIY